MKIQTSAYIDRLSIEGEQLSLPEDQRIELEFSAIDTGGGFKDPILDFSFALEASHIDQPGKTVEMQLRLRDYANDHHCSFAYNAVARSADHKEMEINGRLKEDQLPREVIGFVLHLLR